MMGRRNDLSLNLFGKICLFSAGMYLEILVEDYFTEEKHWVRTKLDYLPQAAGGTQASGWYITEDKKS